MAIADLVIVGGGPVGLSVACYAAQRGRSAVVIERCTGAVDKACGEGLMPPCVRRLERMGVEIPAWGVHPFRGIRYIDGDRAGEAVVAEADFIEGPGLGVRRLALSEGLRARALQLGVEIQEGVEALDFTDAGDHVALLTSRGAVSGRLLVAADGLHSQIRKKAGFAVTHAPKRRLGIRRHFTVKPWSPFVEVWWQAGVEAYVTPTGPERVGLAFLWDGPRGNYDLFLERFPDLAAKLGPPESAIRGAGPFDVRVDRRVKGRVLLVGDAAGYADAITGEGISLGMACAEALVDAVCADQIAGYEAAYRALTGRAERLTRLLVWVARRPWLRRRLVAALARSPSAFQSFLALNSGAYTLTQGLPGAARVGLGLLTG